MKTCLEGKIKSIGDISIGDVLEREDGSKQFIREIDKPSESFFTYFREKNKLNTVYLGFYVINDGKVNIETQVQITPKKRYLRAFAPEGGELKETKKMIVDNPEICAIYNTVSNILEEVGL
jgi:hypothetical protein